jgi:hypothetical protein
VGAKSPNWTDGRNLARHATDEGSSDAEVLHSRNYVYDAGSLTWVRMTQPTAGGGGGGAVTVADGADAAQGTTTDPSSANTLIGLLKAIKAAVTGTLATSRTWVLSNATDSVNVGNFPATQPISGSVSVANFPATQTVAGTVTVANPTANPETGLAKDATLTAALGSAGESPAAWTVLEQLNRIRKEAVLQRVAVQQLVAQSAPKPPVVRQTTLLHRS